MDPTARHELIARYRAGYDEVVAALEGATAAELDARPGPVEWTAREVVHHLADSETMSYIRLRLLLAQDGAVIHAYDEEEFARRLHYERPHERSLEAMRAARDSSAELLEALTEDEWAREGTHTESGRYTVEGWLQIYADHPADHANQIRRARASLSS